VVYLAEHPNNAYWLLGKPIAFETRRKNLEMRSVIPTPSV